MAKALSIGFSQVTQSKEVREFLEESEKTADEQIQAFSKIMHRDNLPVPNVVGIRGYNFKRLSFFG